MKKSGKTAFAYLLGAGFCAFFGYVYEQFSHGVYSMDMIYAFAYPLLGGAIPFLALALWGRQPGSEKALYHCGIVTLTLGSILEGVLEIYGTTNRLMAVYPLFGWLLIVSGVSLYLYNTFKGKNQ
jgi:hypothetical protein